MKKLITCLLVLSSFNAFAYSESKVITKMSEEGRGFEASVKVAVEAILLGVTIADPYAGITLYVFATQGGGGLNADLDFLTSDEKYGLLTNLSVSGAFVTDGTTGTVGATTKAIKASAKKIMGESDAFYADGKVSPEKTPELHRNAEKLSEVTGMEINEAAEGIIKAVEIFEN